MFFAYVNEGGSFGEIYMGVGPNLEKVAVKFEKESSRCPQLRHEYKVYRELVNCHGFCCVYYFGAQDSHNVMVMDLMGPSLEDLFNKCARKFSLKTVLQIADQLLERVDTLHTRHLIHRDIKPANFVIGIGDLGANVYCVDFGLSKRYRHPKTLQHIPHRDGRSLTGTPRYASINNHLGIEQSRRDDLESIAYILIYFLKGTLPWQGLKAKNASKKYLLILSKKQSVSIAQLCQGCPAQFAEFLAYSRTLKFDAKPDIPYLRKIFRDLYNTQGCSSVTKMWDWDAIDADYFTSSPTAQPSSNAPAPAGTGTGALALPHAAQRPATTPANATGAGTGSELDPHKSAQALSIVLNPLKNSKAGEGDGEPAHEHAGNGKKVQSSIAIESTRPSATAPKKESAGQAQYMNWGFARPTGAGTGVLPSTGVGKGESKAAPVSGLTDYDRQPMSEPSQSRRPHTASVSRPGAVDGEGHVVAGARAMMRYRNNKSVDATASNGDRIAHAAAAASGAVNMSTSKGWSGAAGVSSMGTHGTGKCPAVGVAGGGAVGASSMSKPSAVKPASSSSDKPVWVVSDRPRSAAINAMGGTSSSRTASSPAVTHTHGASSSTLSYGNLKSRFLSGTGSSGTAKPHVEPSTFGAQTSSSAGASKQPSGPSKLFANLAR